MKTGALTWTCTTNLRLRKAACRTDYTLRANWRSWPDSHRLITGLKGPPLDCLALTNKMVPAVGIAPTSPRLQRGANLSQLPGVMRLVVPRGNAPRSSGYQPGALLLSYGTGK